MVTVGIIFDVVVNRVHIGSSEFGAQLNFGINVVVTVVTVGVFVVNGENVNGGFVV